MGFYQANTSSTPPRKYIIKDGVLQEGYTLSFIRGTGTITTNDGFLVINGTQIHAQGDSYHILSMPINMTGYKKLGITAYYVGSDSFSSGTTVISSTATNNLASGYGYCHSELDYVVSVKNRLRQYICNIGYDDLQGLKYLLITFTGVYRKDSIFRISEIFLE